jgi:hypothetical protein
MKIRMRTALAAGLISGWALLAGGAASAQAAQTHLFQSSFGSFSNSQGVASDAAGDVYVYDAGAGTVSKFSSAGTQLEFAPGVLTIEGAGSSGAGEGEIAVSDSTGATAGDIYVANESAVLIFSPQGALLGELNSGIEAEGHPWGEACGVAVDGAGNVYVGLYPEHVNMYKPSASPVVNSDYVSSLAGSALGSVCNVAVDSSGGSIYAANYNGGVTKFASSQLGLAEATGTQLTTAGSTLAVDAGGSVYVDEGSQVSEYDAQGTHGTTIEGPAGEPFGGSDGVAVDGDGQIFVADNSHGPVDIFGPLVILPDASAAPASEVQPTSATLEGTVSPDGVATTYRFEYGTTTSYGTAAPEPSADAGAGTSPVTVSVPVTGLKPQTEYHYRLAATNASGTVYSADQLFRTLGPIASIGEVAGVGSTSALLNGAADSRGLSGATFRFTVSASTSPYSALTAEAPVPVGSGSVPVSTVISGLPSGETYVVRLSVTAGGATAYSEATTFQTAAGPAYVAPSVPAISTNPYSGLTVPFVTKSSPPATTPAKPKAKAKPLTRAQKLTKALKVCHLERDKRKRAGCEARAKKQYGSKSHDTQVDRRAI